MKKLLLKLFRIEKQYYLSKFHHNFKRIRANFFFEIYHKIPLLEWILCSLCELEMSFKLLLDSEFKRRLDTCGTINKYTGTCDWQDTIPKNTDYCGCCDYKDWSNLAEFFFGDGEYCYFEGKGGFNYISLADPLLFNDGFKCCGIGDRDHSQEEEDEN